MAVDSANHIPTVRVQSWAELMTELYRDAWDPGIQRHRAPVVYRGMGSVNNTLNTTLIRLGEGHDNLARLEAHLLRNFRKYGHPEMPGGESIWNTLALAAHHALPTRLLDWTYSPLVALHFATVGLARYDEDGVVWCVNHRETNQMLPSELRDALAQEGSDVFTVEMLNRAASGLDALERLSDDPYVLFLEPPSVDARIVNQFALFSLVSVPDRALDTWLTEHPALCRRIILPASLKWEIRDKLDQSGVTERVLFPGLDGLTAWLTRYYTPRNLPQSITDPDCADLRHK